MAPISPPTSLPPLRSLANYSIADITRALKGIRDLYWPPPRPLPPKLSVPTRRTGRLRLPRLTLASDEKIPDSGYASAVVSDDECDIEESLESVESDSSDAADELRANPVERTFAIHWITGLIGRIDELSVDDPSIDPDEAREILLDDATAVLAQFSHHEDDAADFDITRSFSFPSQTKTVEIELNDAPLSASDHTSVGLQSWGSAIILGERLCADPASFNFTDDGQPLRILELGAGTGLLSIAAAKLLPTATVVATDYHPAILANLNANLRTNFGRVAKPSHVFAAELDWSRPALRAPFDTPFDVVLAADVVYHADHARWIHGCVQRMLRRPRTNSASDAGGIFHLIIPVRTTGRHEGLDKTVDEVFGVGSGDPALAGCRLAILQSTALARQGTGVGRADESGYRLFKIGWVS
ncbi:putative methyltransferase-domain-containing protein [Favolaschia claudopus]|uniref:Methyltransferase-domain-containing protein n=1 Tax=Favolaschia claudopus TaxID=2862362 RepID=A0AAW0EBY6_9AGAR